MNFDFAAVLVSLVFVTGGIWVLDSVFWAPKRRLKFAVQPSNGNSASVETRDGTASVAGVDNINGVESVDDHKYPTKGTGIYDETKDDQEAKTDDTEPQEPRIVEYARSFFPVILIVLLLRSFLVEPFKIPSNSMMPTLLTGDFILVNKFAYGIVLPVINFKLFSVGAPDRGDVIVFRYPRDPSIDYIKRVVGLPGDHIVYKNKRLTINNNKIDQSFTQIYAGKGAGVVMSGANLINEQLDTAIHDILVDPRRRMIDMAFDVPQGHYFVMGDNRDNSNDSRFWGTVPKENLVGKAFFIWMNWDSANGGVAWSRIGSKIM